MRTVNSAAALVTSAAPPCAATISRTRARPRPAPPAARPRSAAGTGERLRDRMLGVEVTYIPGRVDGDLHQLLGADPLSGHPGKAVTGLAQGAGHTGVDRRFL